MLFRSQKIQEAMGKIRRNALGYSVRDYEEILEENLATIGETKQKFQNYRTLVINRARELEETNINVKKLMPEEEAKLNHLREIEYYLNRTIDEHQRILNSHFDLKALYTKELEELTRMSLIQRFSLRTELYDKVLEQPDALGMLDYFLRPLFVRDPDKGYNLNKAFQFQKPVRKTADVDTEETMDFDEEKWQQEQERLRREKLTCYEKSLGFLLKQAAEAENKEISLLEIRNRLEEQTCSVLIPSVEIFKEIMVEMIKNKEIDVEALRKEQGEYLRDQSGEFQLNEMLLQIIDEHAEYSRIRKLEIFRREEEEPVVFEQVPNRQGQLKNIRCSNVIIRIIWED